MIIQAYNTCGGTFMKFLSNKIFSIKTIRFINYIFYALFLLFAISLITAEQSLIAQVLYSILVAAILYVVLTKEHLDSLVQKAIYAMNFEMDYAKAKEIYDSVEKKDIFKSYRKQRILFDVLWHLGRFESQIALNLIEANKKYFSSNLDSIYIRNTSSFYAYIQLGNRTQANRMYPEITKLRSARLNGKKLSALYNWEELEALHHFINKDYKKAKKSFTQVNTQNMNNKETLMVSLFQYFTHLQLNEPNTPELLQQIKQNNPPQELLNYMEQKKYES